MTITTLTTREFDQDVNKAKRAAKKGPVFITARGRPEYVLLSIEDYGSFMRQQTSIAEVLAIPGAAEIELDLQPLEGKLFGAADLC